MILNFLWFTEETLLNSVLFPRGRLAAISENTGDEKGRWPWIELLHHEFKLGMDGKGPSITCFLSWLSLY